MTGMRPTSAQELRDAVADATRAGTRLEIRSGGSKSAIGAPRDAAILDMTGFAGVIDYDPAELVLTVRAGTPLAEIEALVAGENQMLAFEPFDHGPVYGRPAGAATIGGVVAAGVAGSRRITAGGARDHLLGFRAVSGRGEEFVAGAKVVKNVTGYDLPKLMAGSWGRIAAMTELTLKVLPRPRIAATMIAEGLDDAAAYAAMARALGSHAEVSAAAHLPAAVNGGTSATLFRIAGFDPSVEARCGLLPDLLAEHCRLRRAGPAEADTLWDKVRHASPLDGGTLWRLHLPPGSACALVLALAPLGARWLFDWGGGLVWLECDAPAGIIREEASRAGGQAMLVRAPAATWASVPAHHPRAPGVMALERRVRRAFDPAGVFETGRFLGETYAD
jgi:glycolate oxidase FAD binding subunit